MNNGNRWFIAGRDEAEFIWPYYSHNLGAQPTMLTVYCLSSLSLLLPMSKRLAKHADYSTQQITTFQAKQSSLVFQLSFEHVVEITG